MVRDMVQRSGGTARVLSFESFLQRNLGSKGGTPGADAPESPFRSQGWSRPLSAKEIMHRRTMLNHFRREG